MTAMSETTQLVRALVQAADGEIVGRIRMQKIVYLLEQLGMGGKFWFSYHHFGPYSEDLTSAIEVARFVDGSVTEEERPFGGGFSGSVSSVYRLADPDQPEPAALGFLPWADAKAAVARMKRETSVVIELAATIHWLREQENVAEWEAELKVRKPSKADDDRIGRALSLLRDLHLAA